jgi:hypothetical protein
MSQLHSRLKNQLLSQLGAIGRLGLPHGLRASNIPAIPLDKSANARRERRVWVEPDGRLQIGYIRASVQHLARLDRKNFAHRLAPRGFLDKPHQLQEAICRKLCGDRLRRADNGDSALSQRYRAMILGISANDV